MHKMRRLLKKGNFPGGRNDRTAAIGAIWPD